jgi:hypothetical protein
MDTMVDALQNATTMADPIDNQGLFYVSVQDTPELFALTDEVRYVAGSHPVLYLLGTDRVMTDGTVVTEMDKSRLSSGHDPAMMIVTSFAYSHIDIVHSAL